MFFYLCNHRNLSYACHPYNLSQYFHRSYSYEHLSYEQCNNGDFSRIKKCDPYSIHYQSPLLVSQTIPNRSNQSLDWTSPSSPPYHNGLLAPGASRQTQCYLLVFPLLQGCCGGVWVVRGEDVGALVRGGVVLQTFDEAGVDHGHHGYLQRTIVIM